MDENKNRTSEKKIYKCNRRRTKVYGHGKTPKCRLPRVPPEANAPNVSTFLRHRLYSPYKHASVFKNTLYTPKVLFAILIY